MCGAIGANQVQVQGQSKNPVPFYPGGSENPTIHGWGGGLRTFFLRKYSGARAFWGNICRLIKGKRGETIRQSDGLLLLCVSLTGPLSEASSPSVVVCPRSLYGVLEQNAS